MVPCECSIEKHGTDAGQSFYVNIYNVIHQNIFVHCRERCGSQQSFFPQENVGWFACAWSS